MYEGGVSETMLVTQFMLGLKEEIRATVEIQLPATVTIAVEYALVQEALLERAKQQATKTSKFSFHKGSTTKGDYIGKSQLSA